MATGKMPSMMMNVSRASTCLMRDPSHGLGWTVDRSEESFGSESMSVTLTDDPSCLSFRLNNGISDLVRAKI